jgi:putative transposase
MMVRNTGIAHVCREHGISRECGHKWWRRFQQAGAIGLKEQSRRPHCAAAIQQCWKRRTLGLRRRHPTWGPEKLRWTLCQEHPKERIPAARTLGRWLARAGKVRRRPRHLLAGPQVPACAPPIVIEPNDLWTIDFKGNFCTRDGRQILPLTVRDEASRYVLLVRHLPRPSDQEVRQPMKRLFLRVGLPRAIRVDNGAPFGGRGARGLTTLSVWWIRLGIHVVFGRRGCPQDNAAHEQMHRVLKAETAVRSILA